MTTSARTRGTITAENDTFVISATGVLPPSISAWNKWFLGWLRMGEVANAESDIRLPAVQIPEDQYRFYSSVNVGFNAAHPQAVRAGVSPREWFLLENRWVPLNAGETPYDDIFFQRDARHSGLAAAQLLGELFLALATRGEVLLQRDALRPEPHAQVLEATLHLTVHERFGRVVVDEIGQGLGDVLP